MRPVSILLLAVLFLFSGCIQSIAVSTVGGIVDQGFSAFTEETDLPFVEQALPGNIKLLEVMLKNSPDNERLLRLTSEGYSSYALAFLEDKDPVRAREFYLRGKEFGMRILTAGQRTGEGAQRPGGPIEGRPCNTRKRNRPGRILDCLRMGKLHLSVAPEPRCDR